MTTVAPALDELRGALKGAIVGGEAAITFLRSSFEAAAPSI